MKRYELPPASRYEYAHVTIDLGQCIADWENGQQAVLAAQPYHLLTLLLQHPGRFLSYRLLAQEVLPEFSDRRNHRWDDLNRRQQEAIKHTLHTLVYRTRLVLGERPDTLSILVNRAGVGYAIQRPLRVTGGLAPDSNTIAPASAEPALVK
jgi:DNA-binding response OmpR family regulator